MSYVYIQPSNHEPHRQFSASSLRTDERTPLGKALRWLAEKSVNEFLDALLRLFLQGGWPVRLAGAIVTGVVAASVTWLLSGTVLSALLGGSFTATAIGLGAAAGLVMGFSGGLLAGAGAGWLLSIAAESISTELTKDRLGLYVAAWIAWCLAAIAGGLAGWAVGWLVDRVEQRSPTAGLVLRILSYLLLFACTAVVLVRTGASAALWTSLATPAEAVGRQSNAFALGVGTGVIAGIVAVAYLLWLVPTGGALHRRHLPLAQLLLAAMIATLATVDSTPASSVAVAGVLVAAIWVLPWAVALAVWSLGRLNSRP
ncbi:hypothetical protein GCM10029976_091420 [Kribbella albertanoniae]|uniref:Uncharacterized protein n=1 Tax=Kribbella albertanoniae TaxID=1266829 RepID=A0A4R4PT09_9ACTN|nr:hypothetical protein [Kribbella albertanoniae]TDC25454.1 hypothetical protein E1261_24125 [Kribbella albertanoniae]